MEDKIKDISKRITSAMNCNWMDPSHKQQLLSDLWSEASVEGIPAIKIQCYISCNRNELEQEINADADKHRRELQDESDRIRRKIGRKL